MKFKVHKFKKVTNTNDVAINLIRKENKISGCVYSETQTNGKGTHGKKWISKEGNFFSSLFFPLKKNFPAFNEFSIINPVIISDVIKKFTKSHKVTLKFPNDIFLNEKKICGILQEMITVKNKKFLIVGIGINLVSNPNIYNKYKATNIFYETKSNPKVTKVISLIISAYVNFFLNIRLYSYNNFKRKAEIFSLKEIL